MAKYDSLLRRVWDRRASDDLQPIGGIVKSLRRKLGDDAAHLNDSFNECRVGYRMPGPNDR